jgi:hypothetical protein
MSVLPSPKPPHSPSVGNELMPSANYDFKFKDYAPWVFCELHEDYFHLDPTDYLLSLGFHTGMVRVGKVQTIPVLRVWAIACMAGTSPLRDVGKA